MIDSKKEELLKKLKSLADRGDAGERENASAMLEKLMKKHGITLEEIDDDVQRVCAFRFKSETDRRVLAQVIYTVTGKAPCAVICKNGKRPRKTLGVECTSAEQIEIEAKYEFYREAFLEELEAFYTAFAIKNRLFPPKEKDEVFSGEDDDETDERKIMKAFEMARGLDDRQYLKQLNQAKGGK